MTSMELTYAQQYRDLYENHWWWRAREHYVLDIISGFELPHQADILDVGCGDGLFFEALSKFGKPFGVEPDEALLSNAKWRDNIYNVSFDENVKERLTQMIVHDLKNPLTGVKANIEIVGMDDLGETRECLDAAQRSCDLLFNMIQDLLDISKMEEGKLVLTRETLDLVEIVSPAVREASVPAQAEDKEVVFELPEDLARVNVDRDFIYRTLSNLMQNAIKHSGRGGIITVSASNTEDKMRVQVKDTGQGIPADFQEKIFEKFGQVETRQRTGSGLGLTFCKMAIEAHDGKIWVESVEGEGSTFIFEVPLKPSVSAYVEVNINQKPFGLSRKAFGFI